MILELYDKEHENKYPLSNYKNYSIKNVLRYGDKELRITIPINSKYAYLVEEEMYIRNKTQEFVIKEVNPSDNYIEIVAKLNIEAIEGKTWETFESKEATITDCINTALAGTWWQVGECNITKKRTIRKDFCNSWEIIKQCVKTYRVEIELDSINKKINIYEQIGTDKGSFFMESLNLRELSVQSNSYDYYTKLIAIGGTVDKEDGTKERISCTVSNNSYSNKVIEQIWKDERYTILEDLREDAQAKLDAMAKPYKSYSAKPYNIGECQLGDTITLISKKNKIYNKFRIVSYTEYPEEVGKDTIEIANSILSFEDLQKEFEEARNTVDNITENNSTISEGAIPVKTFENIYARSVVAKKIQGLEGDFGTLNATKANITELNAVSAKIQNLEVNSATIADLQVANARIGTLESGYGDIKILQSDVATINNLIAGNVSAGSTQTIVLNANNTTIANALIKSAMIESLDVNKINAGTISTNKFSISSDNGAINISDSTMQFKDSNGNVRIQLGQAADGTFNFLVRGEDGKTALLTPDGITENAVADGLIKTDMMADKSVKGKKIDWDDFFTTINADGTHTLNSSKVKLNSNNQTLDVAFNSLTSKVDNIGTGRNYCRKGWWINQDQNGRATVVEGKDEWHDYVVTFNKLSSEGWGILTNNNKIKFEYGKKYTLSFKCHTSSLSNIQVRICSPSSTDIVLQPTTITLNKDNAYRNYKITFTAQTTTSQYLQFLSDNGSIVITNIKLEEGEKATTYCNALEDTEDKIKTNTTAISVQQGKIEQIISDLEQTTNKTNGLVTLTSNYNTVVDTVNKHTQTIGSVTSVEGDGTLWGSVKSNISAIAQLNNQISLKVEQSDVTNAINNLNIGGENLITNGNFEGDLTSPKGWWFWGNCSNYPQSYKGWIWIQNNSISTIGGLYTSLSLKSNTTYTLSLACVKQGNVKNAYFKLEYSKNGTNIGQNKMINLTWDGKRHSYTFTTPSASFDYCGGGIVHEGTTDSSGGYIVQLNLIKLEEGNKATAFSVSPNDLKNYTNSQISVKAAEIKITTDSITSRVSATETTLNADGTGLVSRMSSVEQNITASAITTKISNAINDGTSSINTTYFTQDNTGLTIKNGGIKVLNSLNTQIFGVDTDGQLSIRGKLEQYNSNGRKSIEIKNNALKIYDYKSTTDDLVGGIENLNDLNNTNSGVAVFGKINHRLSLGMLRDDNTIYEHITCVDTGTYRRTEIGADIYNKYSTRYCNSSLVSSGQIGINFNGDKGLCIAANSLEGLHLGLGFDSSFTSYLDIVKDANGNGKVIIYGDLQVMGQINQ